MEIIKRFRKVLDDWMIETADQGEFLESPEIIAPFEKEMHDWFGTPKWYINNSPGK